MLSYSGAFKRLNTTQKYRFEVLALKLILAIAPAKGKLTPYVFPLLSHYYHTLDASDSRGATLRHQLSVLQFNATPFNSDSIHLKIASGPTG